MDLQFAGLNPRCGSQSGDERARKRRALIRRFGGTTTGRPVDGKVGIVSGHDVQGEGLRSRVLAAVDEGMSCRDAAGHFGVAPSTAIRWGAQRREDSCHAKNHHCLSPSHAVEAPPARRAQGEWKPQLSPAVDRGGGERHEPDDLIERLRPDRLTPEG
jgi:hypothetical protein